MTVDAATVASRIPWVPRLPEHWRVERGAVVARPVRRPVRAEDGVVTAFRDGQVVLRTKRRTDGFTEAVQEIGYQGVCVGDLVIHSMDAFAGAIGVAEDNGKMSPVAHLYAPVDSDARYLAHALRVAARAGFIQVLAKGIRERSTSFDRPVFKNLLLPVPPPTEQRAIAVYLDRETARIDELIAKQERLIETLRERRASVGVKGLAETVGAGDRLKWGVREVDRRLGSDGPDLPLLSVSIAWGVRRRDEVTEDLARAEDLSSYKRVAAGELVVNRMRAFQGALGTAPSDGVVSPDYLVLSTAAGIDADWLAAVMRSRAFVVQMASRVRGIGGADGGNVRTPRINPSDLLDIRVAVPSLEIQASELSAWNAQTAKIDALIAKTERFIELSRERRSALITAAVTGQIDVREAA